MASISDGSAAAPWTTDARLKKRAHDIFAKKRKKERKKQNHFRPDDQVWHADVVVVVLEPEPLPLGQLWHVVQLKLVPLVPTTHNIQMI